MSAAYITQWILGIILITSSLGVLLFSKPVHASLSFLVALITLASLYIRLAAEFLGAMQILIYAGAILVLFMFVIILFQDAYQHILQEERGSNTKVLAVVALFFLLALAYFGQRFMSVPEIDMDPPKGFGTVQELGRALFLDFFLPFEAITPLFLVAVVGAFYIGKRR